MHCLLNKTDLDLFAIRLMEHCSKRLHTFSWIWGGFTIDIYKNKILREHDDLDYLTLNLHDLIPAFREFFENEGWQTKPLANGDLKIEQTGIKIHLGHVERCGQVRWTHNGDKGSIWFPQNWLPTNPRRFNGIEVHVVEPEFQYVILERPHMLNPDWKYREKDIFARSYLRSWMERQGLCAQSLFEQVREQRIKLLCPEPDVL